MHNDFTVLRKTALELQSLDSREVVKVAGVARRLKNWIKKITDPEYKAQVVEFQQNTQSLRGSADQLDRLLKDLQSAIKSGDISKYNEVYKELMQLSSQLYTELKDLGDDGKGVEQVLKYYTKDDMKKPGFRESFKKVLPQEYDIELGKLYNRPLKEFMWYKGIPAEQIYVRQGEGVSALSQLIARTKDRIISDRLASPEDAEAFFKGPALSGFLAAFQHAILNGVLISADVKSPSGKIQRQQAGITEITVTTAPFAIPGTTPPIKVQAQVVLIDKRSSLSSMEKLSLKITKHVTVLGSKMADRVDTLKKMALAQALKYKATPMSELDVANSLRKGYQQAFGSDPTAEVLAGGWSQVALENGNGQKIYNYNFGNIKATDDWVRSGKPYAVKSTEEYTAEGKHFVHKDAKWRAYASPDEGAAGYWKLIGNRYKNAMDWMAAGDPKSASVSLAMNKYYTANIKKYSTAVNSLYRHFMERIAPQITGLKSAPIAPPGTKPEVKDWTTEYTKAEKDALFGKAVGATPIDQDSIQEVDSLINALYADNSGPIEKLVKNSVLKNILPTSNVLVLVKSADASESDMVEFARVASTILRQTIEGSATVHKSENGNVELECSAVGNPATVAAAVQALCECVAEGMSMFRGINIVATTFPGVRSKNASLNADQLIRNYRMFGLQRIA